ncbi:MAG: ABC transporter ATP-binding protein [Candidatus Berkelbacteria bacterium]|nr:ABC transporter ATP-binding protein [Candidatus Berkelbacteria bacterium]
MQKLLRVVGLQKIYGRIVAVDRVDFEVNKGEIFALIGPNGAGKSTTLKMIAGLLSTTDGNIFIGDVDAGKNPDKMRASISYLPEDSGAYKNLTGFEYLKFMAGLYSENIDEENKILRKGIAICQLGDRLKEKAKNYSKGMIRKLLLARTMMVLPKLAILDEPTAGLDVLNSIVIRDIIKKMSREGMAVLLSSHNMLEIEYLSDRVAILNHGDVVETGTPAELKKKYAAENLEEVFQKLVGQEKERGQ